ncbi:oxidation resistance protein 1-like isoform X2 [Pollicipes pollicipes]|uniref:oxidation resistance protein 1-like isoform X2 n=1 Tax=Pollicipes pollicipes TaxID=41117 RepID=UPI0018854702|nr:oxidation resistance protein 1-like isoform X2 [Pollicipes pollicipes]
MQAAVRTDGSSTTSQSEKSENLPKLVKYMVQERDTLTSIAARFDCLPTEVMKANRLGARLVFPGQVLVVPSRLPEPPAGDQHTREGLAGTGGGSAVAAAGQQRSRASTRDSDVDELELDRDCLMKYVKIKTRHITDGQGVVTGTLLVTPNCLMFDPNVSDPLVLEHGADRYCVMVPMDYIVSAALFTDIAHMKVKDRGNIPPPDLPPPEVYHAPPKGSPALATEPPSAAPELVPADGTRPPEPRESPPPAAQPEREPEPGQDKPERDSEKLEEVQGKLEQVQEKPEPEPELEPEGIGLAKELTFPELSLRSGSLEEEETDPERSDAAAFPKAFERGLVTPEARREMALGDGDGAPPPTTELPVPLPAPAEPVKDTMTDSAISLGGEGGEASEPRAGPGSQPPAEELLDETKKQKVWKRLSHPLTWMESLSGAQEREPTPSSAPPHLENTPKSMLSNVVSSVSSVSNAIASSPRYIVDLGSGLLSSLSPGDAELGTTPAGAPREPATTGRAGSLSEQEARKEGNSVFYTERSSLDRRPRAQASFGGYKNLVSMDERPSLFTSFDELIPKPSQRADDPPLYLCLIMGKRKGRKIRKTVRIVSYGEEKLRSELWFSIPRDKCDQLYHFIQYWAPEIYGSLQTTKPEERGFELVDSDSDIWEADEGWEAVASDATSGEAGLIDLPRQLPKQSWEVIKAPYVKLYSMIKSQTSATSEEEMNEMSAMSEELRRALCSNSMTSMDMEFVPDLVGKSELLTDEIRKSLCKKLPPRVEGHPWSLIFSSSEHGFSLKSLYRKTSAYECPMILFVQDTNDHVFGALCSTTIHMSEHYYGTGETFLFTFYEQFRTYGWSGENLYFARGSPDGLEFGSGDGHYGLYLDGDLYRGRTQCCLTYRNEPLTCGEDFTIRAIELWALT